MTTYQDVPPVMDVRQAAAVLGCSERHLRGLIADGRLQTFRLGRLIRIARHHLLELAGAPEHDEDPAVRDGAQATGGDTPTF